MNRVAEEITRAIRSPLNSPTPPTRRSFWRRKGILLTMVCLVLAAAIAIPLYLGASPKKVNATENRDINEPLFWRSHHRHISGYFAASCNTCPPACAFYVPPSEGIIKMAKRTRRHSALLWNSSTPRTSRPSAVASIFGTRPGTLGTVRRADRALAAQLYQRGLSLKVIENALVLAATRRPIRPVDAPPLGPIRSLAYFLPVVEEVLALRASPDYFEYLRYKLARSGSTP